MRVRKLDVFKSRYIKMFNNERLITNALAGTERPQQQEQKLNHIIEFLDKLEKYDVAYLTDVEILTIETQRYTVHVAVTLYGGILFCKTNKETGYISKPHSMREVRVVLKAIYDCI